MAYRAPANMRGLLPPRVLPEPHDGLCESPDCGKRFYMRGVDLDGHRESLCVVHFVRRAKRNAPFIKPTAEEVV